MYHVKIFIDLARLNKPIGFLLLFWPGSWGVSYGYKTNNDYSLFIHYLFLFFLGSVLMRSAGCIFNDIVDRNIDKKVKRTRERPSPSGKITVNKSLFYVLALCVLAFFILIQFNFLTISLGLGSMILAFSYPFMKRFTYWPQLFLGLTFNWGLVMAWTAMNNNVSQEIILLYISAIFWTLGYDTIYGAQDMVDDEIIGLKSTAIKFKKNMKLFVFTSYLITSLILFYLFHKELGVNLFTIFLIFFIISLFFQVYKFNQKETKSCIKYFRMNNLSGLLLFISLNTL